MDIDEKIAEYKANIKKCECVYKASAIGSIREAAKENAEDRRQMVKWLEELKQLKTEHETVKAMRTDLMKLQTYKMFPYEATVYVERDEVLRIFDKYTIESEDEDGSTEIHN